MTDWREELIEQMAKAAWPKEAAVIWEVCPIWLKQRYLDDARAALAVAEPVIREQCAEIARNKVLTSEDCCQETGAKIAAAIREGGK